MKKIFVLFFILSFNIFPNGFYNNKTLQNEIFAPDSSGEEWGFLGTAAGNYQFFIRIIAKKESDTIKSLKVYYLIKTPEEKIYSFSKKYSKGIIFDGYRFNLITDNIKFKVLDSELYFSMILKKDNQQLIKFHSSFHIKPTKYNRIFHFENSSISLPFWNWRTQGNLYYKNKRFSIESLFAYHISADKLPDNPEFMISSALNYKCLFITLKNRNLLYFQDNNEIIKLTNLLSKKINRSFIISGNNSGKIITIKINGKLKKNTLITSKKIRIITHPPNKVYPGRGFFIKSIKK